MDSTSRTPIVVLVAALAAVMLVGCCCAVGTVAVLSRRPGYRPYQLSQDQRTILARFGPPQAFSIAVGEDPAARARRDANAKHRVDMWQYPTMGSQFVFFDGQFRTRTNIRSLGSDVAYPKLRPEQFAYGMSEKDVSKLVGAPPHKKLQLPATAGLKLVAYAWGDQVVATFDDGGLISVTTGPVRRPAPAPKAGGGK